MKISELKNSCFILVSIFSIFISGCNEDYPRDQQLSDAYDLGANLKAGDEFDSSDPEEIASFNRGIVDQELGDTNTGNDDYWLAVRNIGGIEKYKNLLTKASPEELTDFMLANELDHFDARSNEAELGRRKAAIMGPPPSSCFSFLTSIRSKLYFDGPHEYNIDQHGRPSYNGVQYRFWPIIPARRTDSCHSTVRRMGRSDDQAGHLIPTRLGGLDIRANLVPQNGNMNTGIWQSNIEGPIAKCAGESKRIYYHVRPRYWDGNGVTGRPFSFVAEFEVYPMQNGNAIRKYISVFANEKTNELTRSQAKRFENVVKQYCN